jgi:hypothetical protein
MLSAREISCSCSGARTLIFQQRRLMVHLRPATLGIFFSLLLLSPLMLLSTAVLGQEQSILPPSESVAPAIITADSGPKPSGTATSWSRWYRLGVGKAPTGYTVQKVEFWMTGDNRCGSSAQCRELTRSDDQVLWAFRMHGHNGRGASRPGYSVAHIRVIYRTQSTYK